MITKITKINNLGIFRDYSVDDDPPWGDPLHEFKKYNIIFGANGTGKTTLSKLFEKIYQNNKAEVSGIDKLEHEEDDYSEADYKIKYSHDNKNYYSSDNHPFKVKVFNRDYIDKNIKFYAGEATPILFISKEDIQIKDEVEEQEKKLRKIGNVNLGLGKIIDSWVDDKGKLFSGASANIRKDIKLLKRYYIKEAERDFESLTSKKELNDEELEANIEIIEGDDKHKQDTIKLADKSNDILSRAKELCKETPESKVIERLASKPEISKWVEDGLEIHNIDDGKNNEQTQCEFCLNSLTPDRIKDLLKHFNEADQNLKRKLNNILKRIEEWENDIKGIEKIETNLLYPEFKDDYNNKFVLLGKKRDEFLNKIKKLKSVVEAKKNKRTEEIDLNINLNPDDLFSSLDDINSIIKKHDIACDDRKKYKISSQKLIIDHHLSQIYDEVNKHRANISVCEYQNQKIKLVFEVLENKITEKKQMLFKSKEACDEINKHIKWFFGRREIKLDISESGGGYILKRGGETAKRLSEGEKTAITLIHFVVSFKDENYSLSPNDGIVVVDDPISSLDSDFLFAAFSFLVEHAFIYQQTFILTHNFQFLKMAIRKFKYNKKACHLMIKNKVNASNERCAYIDKLDTALKKFDTEYKYLYKMLMKFMENEKPTIEESIPIPNIARRFLESFIEFHTPSEKELWEVLKGSNFKETEINYIYNFLHKNSHIAELEIDPSLPSKVRRIMDQLFKIIIKVYPKHLEEMENYLKNITESPAGFV